MKDSLISDLKKGFLTTLKISLILTVLFTLIFNQFNIKGIAITFLISAMYSFILGFGQMVINKFLTSRYDWIKQTNARVWSGIICTVLYTVPAVLLVNYVMFVEIEGLESSLFFKGQYFWIHLFYILISFFISSFLHAREFMMAWKKSVKQETTEHKIVAKTETAKFETLKSQIDPHFLFNSLNVLTSLIGENPNQAEKFTTKLSKIYRYVLEQRNKELVPIEEELQFAKTYMELLQMRFEDAVRFEIPSEVTDKELKVVPLSLQLLLENAVKHNVVSSSKPLTIRIFEQDGFLQVENNKNPKDAIGKKSTKVGLRNIADRYGLITHKNVSITNNNKIFAVSLPLLKTSENMSNTIKDLENNKYVKAVEKVEKLKEFYQNLVSYCLVIPFLVFINLKTYSKFQWFWFPAIGWGIGLIFHYLEVNNYNIFLGKNWEERKIKELMDKDTKNY